MPAPVPQQASPRLEKPLRITEHDWPEGTVPVVSICCVTYNHEKFIGESIEGFLMQETTFPVEILIQDDASTDRNADVIRGYHARYPRLIRPLLLTENQFATGRRPLQVLLPHALGEYIALCEGDDYWVDPAKLETQRNALVDAPECVGVFHPAKRFDDAAQTWLPGMFGPKMSRARFSLDDLLEFGNFIPTASVLFRSQFSSPFTAFTCGPAFGDLTLHLLNAKNGPYAYIDRAMSVYRMHSGGIFNSLSLIKKNEGMIRGQRYLVRELGLQERSSYRSGLAKAYFCLAAVYFANGKWGRGVGAGGRSLLLSPVEFGKEFLKVLEDWRILYVKRGKRLMKFLKILWEAR